ncbi:fimbrial protein [Pseudomonas sp. MOB-449]|nr:fimbrial protein [Pseudomonas sp. MOB-449]
MKRYSPHLKLLALLGLAFPELAFAGACVSDSGTKSFDFAFDATFTSPEQNSPKTMMPNAHSWDLPGGGFSGTCECDRPNNYVRGEVFYTSQTYLARGYSETVNGQTMQFYKVNRNIQVAAEVYIAIRDEYVPMPFTSLSNLATAEDLVCSSSRTAGVYFVTGTSGRLHLMIDKPFVGVSVIPRTKLLELKGSLGQMSPLRLETLADVWMTGNIVVPQSCELAPGQLTTIDFGHLNPWEIAESGASPQRTVSRTFRVNCKNISESVAINLSLEGAPHPVQTNALAVNNRTDLAIIMKNHGRIVPPVPENAAPAPVNRIPLGFNPNDQSGEFDLEAYPVKTERNVEPGEFHSQATVKFDFE